MNNIAKAFRQHRPFILIAPLLIIVMTWPTVAFVFDAAAFTVPTRNTDVWQKLWDVWHGRQFLTGHTSFYYSHAMFFPLGLSLAYENFSLPQMLALGLLQLLLPTDDAYSLTYLLIVLAVALSAYVYLIYLFRDRWLATLGACVVCLSQHVLAHAAHPDVNLIVSLPLSAYFFQRAMTENRLKHLLACGIVIGLTAFFSVYIFICALLALALFIAGFAFQRWRDPRFWRWMPLLLLVIALASAARVLPMIADAEELAAALDKSGGYERGRDLLSYFVHYRHPLTSTPLKTLFGAGSPFREPHTSYLGYLPLTLIIIGFLRPGSRRPMLPWLALALPFLLLRLGSVLQIDGEAFDHLVLPKALLDDLFPMAFTPFHATDHFQMGLLLPLAVMTCYGLKSILDARPAKQRAPIVLLLIALIAFEYYDPIDERVMPAEQFAFIDWLRQDGRHPRLINLPMGRHPSKYYGLYQSLTGFPQVEGLSGRTPPSAYATIDGNLALDLWRGGNAIHCFPPHQADYIAALDQLGSLGFTHVIWHYWMNEGRGIASSFAHATPAYSDSFVRIYRLDAVRRSCDFPQFLNPSALETLRRLQDSPLIVPQEGAAILSILPHDATSAASEPSHDAVLLGMSSYTELSLEDGRVAPRQRPHDDAPPADDQLARNSLVLLAYDPQNANPDAIAGYRAWLARRFQSCRQFSQPDAIIEYFLDAAFPCQLAQTAGQRQVLYANGIQLGNLLFDVDGDFADLHLLWTRLPEDAHSVSIQFMDATGARTAGQDFVIGLEPLAHYRIDASTLPPGDYTANLILYNFGDGGSLPGLETASQTRFERALELGAVTIRQPHESD